MGLSLFVDLRHGDQHGCVCEFDPESGGYVDAPRWTGVADMLYDVAEAMTNGRPALKVYASGGTWPGSRVNATVPAVKDDGYLHWEPEPGS